MNYEPLFKLMTQYGLSLLDGEMEEIDDCVKIINWISVKDHLPDNEHWQRVQVNGKHSIFPYSYCDGKWYEYGEPFATECNITHWQPFENLT